MNYPIEDAIRDFDAMLKIAAPRVPDKPEYPVFKSEWLQFLTYLKPFLTGERYFSEEAIRVMGLYAQQQKTSVANETVGDQARCFGVLSSRLLIVNKQRERYHEIDTKELSEVYGSQMMNPVQSLKNYNFFETVNMKGLTSLLSTFLKRYIEPRVTNPEKVRNACSWFETRFFCGVLLCQIVDYLILRDYLGQRRA